MARVLGRAGVLTGLAAAGWFLGTAAAGADELPGAGLEPVAEVASEAGAATGPAPGEAGAAADDASAAADAVADLKERGRSADSHETPVLTSVAESHGVAGAADAAEAGTRQVVETTARGTGEVVTGTVRAGREVGGFADESLNDSELAGTVSDGLGGEAGRLQDQLEQTVDQGPQAGLDEVAATLAPPQAVGAADETGGADEADSRQSESADESADESATDSADPVRRPEVQALAAAAVTGSASTESGQSAGSTDVLEPLTGSALNDTSDSTGTVSSSPIPAAPTGFETNRAYALRLVAQRVALPEDPAVVVRYTADDPSFSPD